MFILYDKSKSLYWSRNGFVQRAYATPLDRLEVKRVIYNHYFGDASQCRIVNPGSKFKPKKQPREKSILADLISPYRPPTPPKKRFTKMKLAVLAYVPPHDRFHPRVFVENLKKFKPKHDLMLYSDDWPDTIKIGNPDSIKKVASADIPQQKWSLNNIIFFTALRIAVQNNVTHILYMESDSRVGRDGWDDEIFSEFFKNPGAIIGGSMVCYNPANFSMEATERWVQAVSQNSRKNFPIPTYGWKGAADKSDSCVFVNGSIGVYDVKWMSELFNLNDSARLSLQSTAWDMEVGARLWQKFGARTYDFVAHLRCMFSSYGEILTTEEQRMQMLRSGLCCAVHQCKSDATI